MRFVPLALIVAPIAALVFCAPPKGRHDEEGYTPSALAVPDTVPLDAPHAIKTVWVIVMENKSWSSMKGSRSAPYINGTLLPLGAHAERYTSPFNTHPSEPNYIWMEAADDLEIADNDDPKLNYRTTKNHLTRHMDDAKVSWKSYQEAIEADRCPLVSRGKYAAKHNPFVFFDDVTEGRNPLSPYCIAHVRPFQELARDLEAGTVARYNFITPDMCNDMHDTSGCASPDSIANGDAWLSREVPKILASAAYRDGGALFITWDEGDDGPIGMIALSPFAKPGYAGHLPYTHASLVRTLQEIFSLRPFMRHAGNTTSFADLFTTYP